MKKTRVARILLLLNSFYGCALLTGQVGGFDSVGLPNWLSLPEVEVLPKADSSGRSIRSIRSSMFNMPGGMGKPLDGPSTSSNEGTGGSHDYLPPDPLPLKSSDAIVTGIANTFQPFLSGDHARVYSELRLEVEDILKATTSSLRPGSELTLLQEGGTLKLTSGKTVSSVPFQGANPLCLKTKHLLFLSYIPQANAYKVLRAWDITDGRSMELDNDGHPYVDRVTSVSNQTTTDDSLLAFVRSRISQR